MRLNSVRKPMNKTLARIFQQLSTMNTDTFNPKDESSCQDKLLGPVGAQGFAPDALLL